MPPAFFTISELVVAAAALTCLSLVSLVKDNGTAALLMLALMATGGLVMVGSQLAAPALFEAGPTGGALWTVATGTGIFLGSANRLGPFRRLPCFFVVLACFTRVLGTFPYVPAVSRTTKNVQLTCNSLSYPEGTCQSGACCRTG